MRNLHCHCRYGFLPRPMCLQCDARTRVDDVDVDDGGRGGDGNGVLNWQLLKQCCFVVVLLVAVAF